MQLQSFSGPLTDDVPVRASQRIKLSVSSLVQLASGSNEPGEGGRRKISGSVCVSVVEVMVFALMVSAVCSARSKLLLRYEPLKKSCESFFSWKIPKNQKATTENLPLTLHFVKCNLINF